MISNVDLAVVGAGPAGLSAAAVAARYGLSVMVLDEYLIPGGRLLGQLHEEPGPHGRPRWWKGREVAKALLATAAAAGVTLQTGVQVWGLEPGWTLRLSGGADPTVKARTVLLATGAGERAMPVPGWTLPGVVTVGAAQVFTNVHRVRPGNRVLICGVDPLSLTVARELKLAGVEVPGIVLPPAGELSGERGVPVAVIRGLTRVAHLAPSTLLRSAGAIFQGEGGARLGARLYPAGGVRVWGVPLQLTRALVRIQGTDSVTGAVVARVTPDGAVIPGTEQEIAVDCVALSGGLSPVVELAAAAGCRLVPSGLGGPVPLHSPAMETELPGLLVAGNITGVEGARIAMVQGKVAGLTAAWRCGAVAESEYLKRQGELDEELSQTRAAAAIQFYPDAGKARHALAAAWRGQVG